MNACLFAFIRGLIKPILFNHGWTPMNTDTEMKAFESVFIGVHLWFPRSDELAGTIHLNHEWTRIDTNEIAFECGALSEHRRAT
jgi:hypothetical protein